MSNQLWTKENATYENWVMEIHRFFFTDEWAKILNPFQTFFPLYLSGITVAEGIQAGHIVSDLNSQEQTIASIEEHMLNQKLNERIDVLEKNRVEINQTSSEVVNIEATLKYTEHSGFEITLHKVVRTSFLWEATDDKTGETLYLWDYEFNIGRK